MTDIPKEVYSMTGYEKRYKREEDGQMIVTGVMVSRPGVDMSDLVIVEELGLADEVTKEMIVDAQSRIHKKVRGDAWKFLKELVEVEA